MKAMRSKHDVSMHWCEYCAKLHEDLCGEGENEDTGEYEYHCNEGHRTTDESMIFDVDRIWICGNCGTQYGKAESAEECCL